MAIATSFAPKALTVEQYNATQERLVAAGQAHPAGRQYHAVFGEPGALSVFAVWDSIESFQAFGAVLMPIAAELGIDVGTPMVAPVHLAEAG